MPDHPESSDYAAVKEEDYAEKEGECGAETHRSHVDMRRSHIGKKASVDAGADALGDSLAEQEDASAEWLSALLERIPRPVETPAVSTLFEATLLPVDTPTAEVETAPGAGADAHAEAHVASLWHPLVQDYDQVAKKQLEPVPTAAAVPQDKGCGEEGEKKCVCGPVPLTVSSGCETVTYDPCGNTLQCNGGGYY